MVAVLDLESLSGALTLILFGVACFLVGYVLGRLARRGEARHAEQLGAYQTFIERATGLRLCLWRNHLSPSPETTAQALSAWYEFLAAQATAAVHSDAMVAQALSEVRQTLRKAAKDDPHVRLGPALGRLVAAVKRQLGYDLRGGLTSEIDERIDQLVADLSARGEHETPPQA